MRKITILIFFLSFPFNSYSISLITDPLYQIMTQPMPTPTPIDSQERYEQFSEDYMPEVIVIDNIYINKWDNVEIIVDPYSDGNCCAEESEEDDEDL